MIDKICLIFSLLFHVCKSVFSTSNIVGYDKEVFFVDNLDLANYVTSLGSFSFSGKHYSMSLHRSGTSSLVRVDFNGAFLTPTVISYYRFCDSGTGGVTCFGSVVSVLGSTNYLAIGTMREPSGTGNIYLTVIDYSTLTGNDYLWNSQQTSVLSPSTTPIGDINFIELVPSTNLILTPGAGTTGVSLWTLSTLQVTISWTNPIEYENCLCLNSTFCILHTISTGNHLLYSLDPTLATNSITFLSSTPVETDTDTSLGETFSFFGLKSLPGLSAFVLCTNNNCFLRENSAPSIDINTISMNRISAFETSCPNSSSCFIIGTNDLSLLEVYHIQGISSLYEELTYLDTEYSIQRFSAISAVDGEKLLLIANKAYNQMIYVEQKPCHPSCFECTSSEPTSCLSCGTVSQEIVPINLCVDVAACDPACAKCYGTSNTECDQCSTGTFLDIPTNICSPCDSLNNPIYTKSSATSVDICKACHPTCLRCNMNTQYNCLSCDTVGLGRCLNNSQCILMTPGIFALPNTSCALCDTSCTTCLVNSTHCTSCSLPLYLSTVLNACLNCSDPGYLLVAPVFPNTFSTCEPCDPASNCLACSLSTFNCSSCQPGYELTQSSGPGTYQICTLSPSTCNMTDGYYIDSSNQCVKQSAMKIKSSKFLIDDTKVSVEFSSPIDQQYLDVSMLTYTLIDQFSKERQNLSLQNDIEVVKNAKGITILFRGTVSSLSAAIEINNDGKNASSGVRSSDGSSIFNEFPITIKDIRLGQKLSTVSKTIKTALSILSLTSFLLLLAKNPFMANRLYKLLSNLLLIRLLNSPILVLPEIILSICSDINIVPFNIPNLLQDWLDEFECTPYRQIERRGFSCDIFTNYYEDITISVSSLIVCVAITLVCSFIIKRLKSSIERLRNTKNASTHSQSTPREDIAGDQANVFSPRNNLASSTKDEKISQKILMMEKWSERIKSFKDSYGMTYMIVMMDGNMMEVLLMSIIHIQSYHNNQLMNIGLASISFIFFYYFMTLILKVLVYRHIRHRLSLGSVAASSDNPKRGEEKKVLERIGGVEDYPLSAYTYEFEDSVVCEDRLVYIQYIVQFVRSVALCVVCVGSMRHPVPQHVIVMCIECVYVWVLWRTRKGRENRAMLMYDLFDASMFVVYVGIMVGATVAKGGGEEVGRDGQRYVGGAAALVLVLIIVVCVLFVVWSMIQSAYSMMISMCKSGDTDAQRDDSMVLSGHISNSNSTFRMEGVSGRNEVFVNIKKVSDNIKFNKMTKNKISIKQNSKKLRYQNKKMVKVQVANEQMSLENGGRREEEM